jgi:putative ABC transport system permease protein
MRWLIFAYLNVIRNGRRSMLTILVTAIAMMAILTSAGFALFTYHSLAEKAARDEGNLTITHPKFFTHEEDVPMEFGLKDQDALIKQLSTDEAIRDVLPRVNFNGLISNGDKSSIFIGLGVEANEFRVKGPFLNIIDGSALSNYGDPQDLPQIMLTTGLARNMKASVGNIITLMATTTDGALNAYDFQVKGIYTTGVPDLDKRQLYVNLSDAQSLIGTDKVSSLAVYLFDIEQTQTKLDAYQQRDNSLLFTPWWQRAFYYQSVKGLYNRIFGLLGIIMVLLVFFSISNTMGMTVAERTREIGTISAMGSYKSEIIRNFTLEAGIIGCFGAILGVALSGGVVMLLSVVGLEMPPPPGSSQGYPLFIEFSWVLALASSAILTVTCILAALKAANKGCSKTITEALSHV